MTIQKAFQRLFWRFGNGKFEPNPNDIEALNFLANWVNQQKKDELRQNGMFAKVYVNSFGDELKVLKNVNKAQTKIHEVLKMPIVQHYELFTELLNEVEFYNFSKSIGFKDFGQDIKERDILVQKNQKELEAHFTGKWSYEKVEQSLNNQITEAINKYKLLP